MVNHRARFLISFTAAAIFGGACSDDNGSGPTPPDDAAAGPDASADGGRAEAGAATNTPGPSSPDAAGPDGSNVESSTYVSPSESVSTNTSVSTSEGDAPTTTAALPTSSEPPSEATTSELATSGHESTSDEGVATPLPGNVVFAADQVLDIDITLSPASLTNLEQHGNLEAYLPGEVTISGAGFETYSATGIGVRYKGSYSLHHCWEDEVRRYDGECQKLSLKLKFDEFGDDQQRFDGLKRLNLHASSGDNSKFRELLAYNTFAEFGVDAPRISIARVCINGELRGLYFAVEELDGRYAAAHYPDGPDGNLYKEIWPVQAQTEEAYVEALETNDKTPDVTDIQGFAEAIDNATAETFLADMAPWVDIDNVVRYLVVDRAMKNWDGIMAFYDPIRPHNFFWYHDTGADARFHLIPWDLDNTFWTTDPYMTPREWALPVAPVPDWNVTPLDCEPRVVWEPYSNTYVTPPRCDKFLDLLAQTQWERFVELGSAFKANVLESPNFKARIDHWETLLAPLVAEDPTLDQDWVAGEQTYFRDIIDDIIYDFGQYMDRGLTEEYLEPGPVLLPEPTEEELAEVTPQRGIEPGRVTNFEFEFEFESPADSGFAQSYTFDAPYASTAPDTSALASTNIANTNIATIDGGIALPPSALDASLDSTASNDESSSDAPTEQALDGSAPPEPSSRPLPFSDVVCDPSSTVTASWNTLEPIAGSADARIDFVHNRTPGAYNEWVNLFLFMNDGIVDVTGYTQIEMTLRTDKPRSVRVRIGGAAAGDEFGGAWDEFGEYFYVDSYPTHVVLRLHDLTYPSWAKDAWEVGQGWEFADEVARERFLATMWGLIFVPGADVDYDGELVEASDPGYLEIDNIYFR